MRYEVTVFDSAQRLVGPGSLEMYMGDKSPESPDHPDRKFVVFFDPEVEGDIIGLAVPVTCDEKPELRTLGEVLRHAITSSNYELVDGKFEICLIEVDGVGDYGHLNGEIDVDPAEVLRAFAEAGCTDARNKLRA